MNNEQKRIYYHTVSTLDCLYLLPNLDDSPQETASAWYFYNEVSPKAHSP